MFKKKEILIKVCVCAFMCECVCVCPCICKGFSVGKNYCPPKKQTTQTKQQQKTPEVFAMLFIVLVLSMDIFA